MCFCRMLILFLVFDRLWESKCKRVNIKFGPLSSSSGSEGDISWTRTGPTLNGVKVAEKALFDDFSNARELESYIDDIPVEEKKSRLKRLLNENVDTNRDEVLDQKELEKWASFALATIREVDVENKFHEWDANSDGKITWDEFEKPKYIPPLSGAAHVSRRRDRVMFDATDEDLSFSLDLKEFETFHSPRTSDALRKAIVDEALRTLDDDEDGAIDVVEFQHHTRTGQEARDEWYELDRNKNTLLDRYELLDWLVSNYDDEVLDLVNHVSAVCDEDRDGSVTIGEVVAYPNHWVYNQMTAYGRIILTAEELMLGEKKVRKTEL